MICPNGHQLKDVGGIAHIGECDLGVAECQCLTDSTQWVLHDWTDEPQPIHPTVAWFMEHGDL